MLALYALSIFLAAALLFVVQPMVGKGLLPLLGGAPAVWTTCMLFFQSALLAGYAYAHGLSTRLKPAAQLPIHAAILSAGVVATWLWIGRPTDAADTEQPVLWLLMTLSLGIGPGFFVIASAGPLLQRWFSRTGHRTAGDPYFLYAASNCGSLLGLVGYPLLVEPSLGLPLQRESWAFGLTCFALLALVCGAFILRAKPAPDMPKPDSAQPTDNHLDWKRRGLWVFYAFVPSSLLIAVTTYISTDVAAVPLLWVVPLAIYLISFIVAFGRGGAAVVKLLRTPTAITIALAAVMQLAAVKSGVLLTGGVALLGLALIATYGHARLAADRPPVRHLTEFFLLISVGGALGGVFNGIIAPLVFNTTIEYAVTLVAAAAMLPWGAADEAMSARVLLRRYGLPIGLAVYSVAIYAVLFETLKDQGGSALLLAVAIVPVAASIVASRRGVTLALCVLVIVGSGEAAKLIFSDQIILRERTFFGQHRVERKLINPDFPDIAFHALSHGTTLHGVQLRIDVPEPRPADFPPDAYKNAIALRDRYLRLPTSYYHPSGPLGETVAALRSRGDDPLDVAVIGLGAGSIAAYGQPGDRMTFIEIDPAVIRIARDPTLFSFLADSSAEIDVRLGDGRLLIAELPDASQDLIVLDAFSSDAVPAHLLTVEAIGLYATKLKPGGYIAAHVSNRVLDLYRVIAPAARTLGYTAVLRSDETVTPEQDSELKRTSLWMVIARQSGDLAPLAQTTASLKPGEGWGVLPQGREVTPWTDDYSNILDIIVWQQGPPD